MSQMTKEERAWVKKLQRVLDECPSDRLGHLVATFLGEQLNSDNLEQVSSPARQ